MVSKKHDTFDIYCRGLKDDVAANINMVGSAAMWFSKESDFTEGVVVLKIFEFRRSKNMIQCVYSDF